MMLSFLEIEWIKDAVIDSFRIIPFLFLVFLFIEIFEHFWAHKIKGFLKHSKKQGPFVGPIVSSIPQCGFSVIASTLYTEKFITRGTIVAVYLATSDEAIPLLLMYPEFVSYVIPLIVIKLLTAIPIGYLVDFIFKKADETPSLSTEHIEGCCRHDVVLKRKRDFLIHPVHHTFSIFLFILCTNLILNYVFEIYDISEIFKTDLAYLTPLLSSLIGLIPNCAVSVGLCMLFIKGVISFGALISGLMTSSGIGLLILLKNNNDKKDTALILSILVIVGYITGALIQTFLG